MSGLSPNKRHAVILLGLLFWGVCVQAFWFVRAPLPSQDAVRWVASAQCFDEQGFWGGIRHCHDQPLFPWLVHAAHGVIHAGSPQTADSWRLAVQGAAALSVVLCLIPFYSAVRIWFGTKPAWIATALLAFLPQFSRLGADGLADATLLWMLCMAAWAVAWGGRASFKDSVQNNRSTALYRQAALLLSAAATGMFFGLALLTHEIAWCAGPALALGVLLASIGLIRDPTKTSTNGQPQAARLSWKGMRHVGWLTATCLCVASVPATVCGGYLKICGAETGLNRLLGRGGSRDYVPLNPPPGGMTAAGVIMPDVPVQLPQLLPDGQPLTFPTKESTVSRRTSGLWAAIQRVLARMLACLGPLPLLALAFLWRTQVRRKDSPGAHVVWQTRAAQLAHACTNTVTGLRHQGMIFVGLLSAVLLGISTWHASKVGYLSARHLLPALVWWLAAVPAIEAALRPKLQSLWQGSSAKIHGKFRGKDQGKVWAKLQAMLRNQSARDVTRYAPPPFALLPMSIPWCTAALLVACWLPQMAHQPHASRAAHISAAHWLQQNALQTDVILDTRGWTALFTGRMTYRYDAATTALVDPRLTFVVIESQELDYQSDRAKTLKYLLATCGQPAARFEPIEQHAAPVLIYRWFPPRVAVR